MKKLGLYVCSAVLFFSCSKDEPKFNFDENKLMDKIWKLEGKDKTDGFRLTKDYKYEAGKHIGTAAEVLEEKGTWAITEGRLSITSAGLEGWDNNINVTELNDTVLKFELNGTPKSYKKVAPSKAALLASKTWKIKGIIANDKRVAPTDEVNMPLRFMKNGEYGRLDGESKFIKDGSWSMSTDGKLLNMLSDSEGLSISTVRELTETSFVMEITMSDDTGSVTMVFTYNAI